MSEREFGRQLVECPANPGFQIQCMTGEPKLDSPPLVLNLPLIGAESTHYW